MIGQASRSSVATVPASHRSRGVFARLAAALIAAGCAALLLSASASAAGLVYEGSFDGTDLPPTATGSGDTTALTAAQTTEITTKHGEITTKQGEITAKQSAVSTRNNQVSTKHGEISTKQGELATAAEPQKKELEEEIEELEEEIEDLEAEITAINGEIGTINGEIGTIEAEIVAIEAPAKTITNFLTSTGSFEVGQRLLGAGIPTHATITAVGAGSISISKLATATATGVSLTAIPDFTPGQLAVNQETGDVYVLDLANDAIRVFDSEGNYLSSIPGSSIPGAGTFNFPGGIYESHFDDDIAIDNSGGANQGDIYVVSGYANYFAFDPSGGFLWQNASAASSEPCGIAVDANGNLFGSAYGTGVQKLDSANGDPEGTPILAADNGNNNHYCQIAFDSSGDLDAKNWGDLTVRQFLAPTYASGGPFLNGNFNGEYLRSGGDVDVDRKTDSTYIAHGAQLAAYGPSNTVAPAYIDSGASGRNYLGVTFDSLARRLYASDNGNHDVEIFGSPSFPFNLFSSGTGTGTVTCKVGAAPAGPCEPEYLEGTEIELSVTATHSTFTGWTVNGADSTTCIATASPCMITIGTEEVFAEPAFAAIKHTLGAGLAGPGTLTCKVGAAPAGPCATEYNEGTAIEVKATPDAHAKLTSLAGTGSAASCSASPCIFTIEADSTLSAAFAQIKHTLTLAKSGTGSGSITCNSSACAAEYDEGATITLTATPASGSTFTGWSGAGCSGTADCKLTLGADTSVTATFTVDAPKEKPECSNTPSLCPVNHQPELEQCTAAANKAFTRAKRAAAKKHGKAKRKAIKKARSKKSKALASCKAQFA